MQAVAGEAHYISGLGRGSAREYEKNPGAVAMYGGAAPPTALRRPGFN